MTDDTKRREAFTHEKISGLLDCFGRDLDVKGIINTTVMLTVAIRTAMEAEAEHQDEKLKEAEMYRDRWWKVLCNASDALGGPTPEKALSIDKHVAYLVAERDAARAVAEKLRDELEAAMKRPYDHMLSWENKYEEMPDAD
jgi:hypothetical protein